MALAAAAGAASAVLSAALVALLKPTGLPILATPFILTTQAMLCAVSLRTGRGRLQPVVGALDSPERTLTRTLSRDRRYPDPLVPAVFLPVLGRW